MGSIQEKAPSIPQPHLTGVAPGISLLRPLSRRGHGPGIVILTHEDDKTKGSDPAGIYAGVPSGLIKWAEEGYVVVEVRKAAWQESKDPLIVAVDAIFRSDACDQKESVGLVAYSPDLWRLAANSLEAHPEIVGAVIYGDTLSADSLATATIPVLTHLAGQPAQGVSLPRTDALTAHSYPTSKSFSFATPVTDDFHYANEAVSHTRNLTFLKKRMNGPFFDLEAIWDEHTYYEFEDRSVPKTMATMVQEPYVNHIPTITGGIGRASLTDFYQNHFIHSNPPGTELELISRTVGVDRVVDEFIFKFTHTTEVPWLVPGIPPTQRRVEVPFTAVVNIRGDRLYHEHIAWDQATVLRQLGLLPEYLPWPAEYQIKGKEGKSLEYRVPAAGVATADKMRDKNSVQSNEMFEYEVREVERG